MANFSRGALPFEIHRLPDISMVPVRVDARGRLRWIRGGVRLLRGNKKSLIIDQVLFFFELESKNKGGGIGKVILFHTNDTILTEVNCTLIFRIQISQFSS